MNPSPIPAATASTGRARLGRRFTRRGSRPPAKHVHIGPAGPRSSRARAGGHVVAMRPPRARKRRVRARRRRSRPRASWSTPLDAAWARRAARALCAPSRGSLCLVTSSRSGIKAIATARHPARCGARGWGARAAPQLGVDDRVDMARLAPAPRPATTSTREPAPVVAETVPRGLTARRSRARYPDRQGATATSRDGNDAGTDRRRHPSPRVAPAGTPLSDIRQDQPRHDRRAEHAP
jgi:hypothetical protein